MEQQQANKTAYSLSQPLIITRTAPNVMQAYGCSQETAQLYIVAKVEGYGMKQARLMAGLSDPPEPDRLTSTQPATASPAAK